MGRDVIFYIGFFNLTEGSGDFVTSVEVAAPTEEQPEIPAETEPIPIISERQALSTPTSP